LIDFVVTVPQFPSITWNPVWHP